MILKFNVFGKAMSVHKSDTQWLLFNESDAGMRSRVYDVVIPVELNPDEIRTYLDDIFHEYSSEQFPQVVKIG